MKNDTQVLDRLRRTGIYVMFVDPSGKVQLEPRKFGERLARFPAGHCASTGAKGKVVWIFALGQISRNAGLTVDRS